MRKITISSNLRNHAHLMQGHRPNSIWHMVGHLVSKGIHKCLLAQLLRHNVWIWVQYSLPGKR